MVIGIDATNIGKGGGVTHLVEILENYDFNFFKKDISKIIIFSSQDVLDQLPEQEILEKITYPNLNKGLLNRVFFQLMQFDKQIKEKCDILFSITGDYVGNFDLVIGMSRNMLLYERDIWKEIKKPKEIIRFWLNFKKQEKSFKNSKGIIFISKYAKDYVSSILDLELKTKKIINHGISPRFIGELKDQNKIESYSFEEPFKLLYVSTVHVYKHQWKVIEAVSSLRKKGVPLELNLVGGVIFEASGKKMFNAIAKEDPENVFIKYHGDISHKLIESFYLNTDGIVYASTCENMPNILIESMASGRPIVCSEKQPMPEFLKEGGYYFDSSSVESIERAIEKLIENPEERGEIVKKNIKEIKEYSWEKTSRETFKFIVEVYKKNKLKYVKK